MSSAFASYGMRVAAARSIQSRSGILARFLDLIEDYRARQAAHELAKLDDRLLRDIGIDRGQIEHVVRFGRR